MKVKVIKSEGLSHELEVTVPANDIESRLEARLREIGKTASMHGFRKGKIPPKMLKKRFGKRAQGDVVQAAVFETFQVALHEQNIKAAVRPSIGVKNAEVGEDLVYSVSVESLPDLEIADLKGIKLTRLVASPDADRVDQQLQRIAEANPSTKPVETDRASQQGDTVIIDLQGRTTHDDVQHESLQGERQRIRLGSGQFVPGFEAQLAGKKVGDDVEVKVNFPETYDDADLAGRKAIIDVRILELHEPVAAEIDDELAVRLGRQDLPALRDAAEQELVDRLEEMSRASLKRELLDYLDASNTFDVPPGMIKMVDFEFENIIKQIEAQRTSEGEQGPLADSEKQEYRSIAERRVRLGLIISEIGNSQKIVVTESDLQQAMIAHARSFPGQEREVVNYFSSNREALESLRAPALEEKVVDFILESAEVTDKSVSYDELLRFLD
ncbi:MAG: trigger factor [Woeseiaceae bacterium]